MKEKWYMTWWIIATLSAYIVKGLCGFGGTLVFSTILSYNLNKVNISPVDLVLGYISNIVMAWHDRNRINRKVCIRLCALLSVGILPGVFLLKSINPGIIKTLFGIVIFVLGIEILTRDIRKKNNKYNNEMTNVVGIAAGVLSGAYGTSAMIAAYLGRIIDDVHEFKGTMGVVLLFENTVRIIVYIIFGLLTTDTVKNSVLLFPIMVTVFFAGVIISRFIDDNIIKKCMGILFSLAGLSLALGNIL